MTKRFYYSLFSIILSVAAQSSSAEFPIGNLGIKDVGPLSGIKPGSIAKSTMSIDLDSVTEAGGNEFFSPQAVKSLNNVRAERPLRGAREVRIYKKHSRSVVLIATQDGLGSGSLIDDQGHILTNWHVISGYSAVAVIFKPAIEGKEPSKADMRRGAVIQVDEVADLALIQVESVPAGVEPIALGDISSAMVGADVHAIGHPTGEAWTYTRGTISQVRQHYEWTSETRKQHQANVIQTQTPINPGNSGGPLLADDGKLIGVNSFKAQGEGLNFAVGVDEVRRFLSSASGDRRAASAPPPKQKSCKMKQLYRGASTDDTMDITGIDLDCDNKPDAELRLPYDIRKPMQLVFDINEDGFPDKLIFSVDREKRWDYSVYDTDFDRGWDLACAHEDGGLEPTRCEPYTP